MGKVMYDTQPNLKGGSGLWRPVRGDRESSYLANQSSEPSTKHVSLPYERQSENRQASRSDEKQEQQECEYTIEEAQTFVEIMWKK